ncbi:MAG: HEAT repeat domain-containing protein [Planctomycetes bacterium]|nr:HEAT repeat domain-containing protein [Planctomycetota bacterium]
MSRFKLGLTCCLLLLAAPGFAQPEGEPIAGGGAEANVRFLLPPTDQVEPNWTRSQKKHGYVVYTEIYNHALWPKQIPKKSQIVRSVTCRMARNEYEPIQIGVYGVGNSEPLKQVRAAVDIDLPFQVRFIKSSQRTPKAKELKHLGATLTPNLLRLGNTHESIEPGHTGAFWITFYASENAKPGKHKGTITISAKGKPDTTLRIVVEVLPLRLPKSDIAFGMYHYRVTNWMNDPEYAKKIHRDMARHGMNSSTLCLYKQPIRYENNRLLFPLEDKSRLHNWMDSGMARPDMPVMLLENHLINWASGNVNDQLSAEQKQDIAKQYMAFAQDEGFPELLAYLTDEPSLDQPPSYFSWATGWKKTPMRTVAALSGKAAVGFGHMHDVWVVHTGQISPEMVREAWRQGAEVWTYSIAMGNYNVHSNRYRDGIYTWALRLRGNFQWAYFHEERYIEYGVEGPDPRISWEGRREGIDDYRYLTMLEALADRAEADNETAQEAKVWLAELRENVDLGFYHGFNGSSRVDGPFCYPAPNLELEDYDRIRAKAADYCIQLGGDQLDRFTPTPYVLSGAAKWEARPFERETVDACITGLTDSDMQVRRAAAASLAERGEAGLPAVEKLKMQLSDVDVRLIAARALQAIGPKAPGAADAIAVLFDDDDTFTRMVAARALGDLGEQSVAGLRKALRDSNSQVVNIAGHALGDIGPAAAPAVPDLIPLISNDNEKVRRAAYSAIVGIGPGAVAATDALALQFKNNDRPNPYIAWAIGAIGPGAKAAIPALEKRRDTRYWSVAINAALFRIRGEKADLDAIVQLLREPGGSYAREYVGKGLEKLGAEAAPIADDVRDFLKEQGDEFAKKKAALVASLNRYLDKVKASE